MLSRRELIAGAAAGHMAAGGAAASQRDEAGYRPHDEEKAKADECRRPRQRAEQSRNDRSADQDEREGHQHSLKVLG